MAHGFFSETLLYVFILVLSQVTVPLRSRADVTSCLSNVGNKQTWRSVRTRKHLVGDPEYSARDLLIDNTVFVTEGWSSR